MQKSILITLKDISEQGGGERVGVNLANAFACELGYQVRVISFFRANAKPFYPLDSKVELITLCKRPAKGKNPLRNLFHKSLFRLWLSYKAHKFAQNADIVLANDGWFVPLFKRKKGAKTLYIRLWHLNAPKKARKKLALFDALVVLSSKELPLWQRYHNNVRVIPNFLPQIPAKSTDSSQKIVLSVGRMDNGDQKGFLRLIEIWKIVQESLNRHCDETNSPLRASETSVAIHKNNRRGSILDEKSGLRSHEQGNRTNRPLTKRVASLPDLSLKDNAPWKLIIVGDGVLKSDIEAKIKALNLQDSIILKPFTKEIEKEYLGASIYAMSSHFEGFGMVLAEASSYGLPCIAFDIAAGPSDIISNEKSGFLIPDGDLQDYADKLMLLMNDESLRAEFGKAAKKQVSEKFSKEAVLKLWQELFEKG